MDASANQSVIRAHALELNSRAAAFEVGRLQELREQLKGRRARTSHAIFDPRTIFDQDGYAFHYGGRTELQFNIGIEQGTGIQELRFGVGFSFERSQNYPRIEELIEALTPKVKRFNDYLELNPVELGHMRMWHFTNGVRSNDYAPTRIAPELLQEKVFVFLGARQQVDEIDYEAILADFDRLLPLYRYVETTGPAEPVIELRPAPFIFRPSRPARMTSASVSFVQRELEIDLRHNLLQAALYQRLAGQYGAENVAHEVPSGVGTRIDIVVKRDDEYWYYEIKVLGSPRACLRQAIGQLLEYGYWPGAQQPSRLIVVGEMPLDRDGRHYLNTLKANYNFELEYQQISI